MAKKKKTKSVKRKKSDLGDAAYIKRYCNVLPDPFDPRDYQYVSRGVPIVAPDLPASVDYSAETAPVGDQAYTGSCVGWATAYGLRRWLHRQQTDEPLDFSVRFVWMGAKEYDPFDLNVAFDLAGTRIRDAFKLMRNFGACPDGLWPFADVLPDPDLEADIKHEALRYRIGVYHTLGNNDERRFHLANEGPFVVGVPVYSNWSTIGADGVVPDPAGVLDGGHAVLVVGYDDEEEVFKFQNSWGTNWGDDGYGYFSYDFMDQHSWSSWGAARL